MNNYSNALTLLARYLRPFGRRVLLLTVLLIGSISLQLVGPQLLRRFLDAAQAGATMRVLTGTAVLFFIVVFIQKVVSLISTAVGEDLGWATTNRLRVDLAQHVLRLDMGFHKLRSPGELIERIDGDVGILAEYFSRLVVQVLGNSLLILGILALQFGEDWRFGLIGLLYAISVLTFLRVLQPVTVRLWGQARQGYADMVGFLEERFNGTEDIRANGGEAYLMARLTPKMARINDLRLKGSLLNSAGFSAGYLLFVLTWVGTLGFAGFRHLNGDITIGTVFLSAYYIALLESPLKYIRRQIEHMQRAVAGIQRIHAILQIEPQVQEQITAVLPHTPLSVTFNQVQFGYKDRLGSENGKLPITNHQLTINNQPSTINNLILQNISFHLKPGRILGILGRTGSGKTTLIRLLFRLYDVDQGRITLAGHDVRHLALADLRSSVGMVTQDVQLFAATVRDNLTLFRSYDPEATPITDDKIIDALNTLGLGNWLQSLPDGLDTELATGGQGLSAGEAQLLALTRVFLRDPQLIILDEASSRLDPATEQRLEQAMDRLLNGRSAIIIAHRLSTI
ncbi:MAG: ABC transporter ATP-binding protein, partial [Anaerolineae bacterium]